MINLSMHKLNLPFLILLDQPSQIVTLDHFRLALEPRVVEERSHWRMLALNWVE